MKVWINLKQSATCDGCSGWDIGDWEPIRGIYATEELAIKNRPDDVSGLGYSIEYCTMCVDVIEN